MSIDVLSERLHVPVAVVVAPARVDGGAGKKAMIVLRAKGCTYDRRPGGGCTYCGFKAVTTDGRTVEGAALVGQAESALARINGDIGEIVEIDLFNSGSFLNDSEIPPDARMAILERVARVPHLRVVLIESRPEYVTRDRLEAVRRAIDRSESAPRVDVAIGLESADDHLREVVLKKGFTRRAYERALSLLADGGFGVVTYVMLKPAPMSDDAALADTIETARYVFTTAARIGIRAKIALEPTFVVRDTPLAGQFTLGLYRPPSLQLVVKAAREIANMGETSVGLWDEDLQPLAVPSACSNCRGELISALNTFNQTGDRTSLRIPRCVCASERRLLGESL